MKRQRGWYNGSGRATKRMRTGVFVSPVVVNRRAAPRRPATYTRRFSYRTGGIKAQTETKYYETGLAGTAITNVAGGDWTNTELDPVGKGTLFAPAPGSGYNQREGKKVFIKKLKIKGLIIRNTQTGLTEDNPPQPLVVRLILYQDKQTNGVQSQGEDVISNQVAGPISGFQNIANFGRFKVHKDKTWKLGNANFAWDGTEYDVAGDIIPFKMNKTFKNPLKINYNTGGNSNISDVVDHSFHLIGGVRGSGGQTLSIEYECRVVFCE